MYVESFHPFVTGYEIDVAPIQGIPYVKFPTRIGRRSIDAERLARIVKRVETMDILLSPILSPLCLFGGRIVVLA